MVTTRLKTVCLGVSIRPTPTTGIRPGKSQIRLQVSRREVPTLPPSRNAQCLQSYFRHLPFDPADITCLALPEIIAEKIRACYQRSKARDIYDLSVFATRPLDQPLIRRLVVLKLWQARGHVRPGSPPREIRRCHRIRLGRSPAVGSPNAVNRACSDHRCLPKGIRLPRGIRSCRGETCSRPPPALSSLVGKSSNQSPSQPKSNVTIVSDTHAYLARPQVRSSPTA